MRFCSALPARPASAAYSLPSASCALLMLPCSEASRGARTSRRGGIGVRLRRRRLLEIVENGSLLASLRDDQRDEVGDELRRIGRARRDCQRGALRRDRRAGVGQRLLVAVPERTRCGARVAIQLLARGGEPRLRRCQVALRLRPLRLINRPLLLPVLNEGQGHDLLLTPGRCPRARPETPWPICRTRAGLRQSDATGR